LHTIIYFVIKKLVKKTGQKPQNPAQPFEDESKVTAVQARKMHPGIKVLLPHS